MNRCNGPSQLGLAVKAIYGAEFGEARYGWSDIRVVRRGVDIGSLFRLRNTLTLWQEQEGQYAMRNQLFATRRRRGANGNSTARPAVSSHPLRRHDLSSM